MAAVVANQANIISNSLFFHVNGQPHNVNDAQPEETLLSYLRRTGYTGTKLGCGEGGCGACTVMVSQLNLSDNSTIEHRSVNACLAPLCSVDGCSVTTVEGIVDDKKPHPAQERIAKMHGSQCGFCTPGIVMSLHTLLVNNSKPELEDIEDCFDGNLCRCTGYRPIIDAAKTFVVDKEACPTANEVDANGIESKLVGATNDEDEVCNVIKSTSKSKIIDSGPLSLEYEETKTTEKDFFPSDLIEYNKNRPFLQINGKRVIWYRPTKLFELLELKKKFTSTAKLIAGNTEVGIETKFKNREYGIMISITQMPDLKILKQEANSGDDVSLTVGGNVTLSELQNFLLKMIKNDSSEKKFLSRGWDAMEQMIRWFASNQIRNVAALAGNVCTASPISDLNPVLMALGASVKLASLDDTNQIVTRIVKLREFFLGYRKVDMKENEILQEIIIPSTRKYEYVRAFKQARRRDDDISIVNACFRINFEGQNTNISEMYGVYGGMAPTTVAAKNLEQAVVKSGSWTMGVTTNGLKALKEDFQLPDNVPGGMAHYRMTLASSLFYKFFLGLTKELEESGVALNFKLNGRDISGENHFLNTDRPITHGLQIYDVPTGGIHKTRAKENCKDHDQDEEAENKTRAPVGQPLSHRSAIPQVTGEAKYTDDIPSPPGTLYAAFVLSKEAHAKILSIDSSKAMALDGVVKFLTSKDLSTDANKLGAILHDEQLFRSTEVTSAGQPLGLIVATTDAIAQRAAKLVDVKYEPLPTVISIDDAIAVQSFHKVHHVISDGDVEQGLKDSDIVLEGEMRVGGQEHFYLECNAALVIPGEGDELFIYCSTQNPTKTQNFAAHACGIQASKVVCKMKRMGGGFGGKETRSVFISSSVALAAYKLNKPVRINIDRDIDMWITGGRHPFIGRYKVGAMKTGKINAIDLKLYNNGGYSLDLTEAVMDRALFHMENAYKIPNVNAEANVCYTNTTSNTAFRGFGGPQGMIICEAYVDHVAKTLGKSPEEIRTINLYKEGERTHFGQIIERNPLTRLMDELMKTSDFQKRKAGVDEFNKNNRWKKRGISAIPTKFGIAFTATFMNQAGALVNIYTDGTVLVTHGGTEMGQGLHTKMIQIASKELNVPVSQVTITETATDKVPNSSPTAASASSDLYGMAVLHACEQLSERLKPYRNEKNKSFRDIVNAAYFDRVNLSAQGFYKMPVSGFDYEMKTKKNWERGKPFAYFTFGAACSEVEIDVLTGDFRILRADIVMDVGNSLNPAIDIGQIEGAFTQGFGLTMMEEIVWGGKEIDWLKPGTMFTRGPGTYKIPSFNDVPIDFRISLLKDNANPAAVHSSRAIGEPPLFLGSTAFFATKEAIRSARIDAGKIDEPFELHSPLTSERIRMSCGDDIANGFSKGKRPNGFW